MYHSPGKISTSYTRYCLICDYKIKLIRLVLKSLKCFIAIVSYRNMVRGAKITILSCPKNSFVNSENIGGNIRQSSGSSPVKKPNSHITSNTASTAIYAAKKSRHYQKVQSSHTSPFKRMPSIVHLKNSVYSTSLAPISSDIWRTFREYSVIIWVR